MTQFTFQTLTTYNVKPNSTIRNIEHPEWGTFRLIDKYEEGIWNLQERVLNEDDFNFWEIKIYNQ